MVFKYEFAESFLLIMLSISFAIDGSLPIRQDENTMYPNVEGHSNQVDGESNQIKKRQDNLRKTDSGLIISTHVYQNKDHLKESLSQDEETNLISNYDYDKYPSNKEFQEDTHINYDKLNEMQNEEKSRLKEYSTENNKDLTKENLHKVSSTFKLIDEIRTTSKPIDKISPSYEPIDEISITSKQIGGIRSITKSIKRISTTSKQIDGLSTNTKLINKIRTTSEKIDELSTTAKPINRISTTTKQIDGLSTIAKPINRIRTTSEKIDGLSTTAFKSNDGISSRYKPNDETSITSKQIGGISTTLDSNDGISSSYEPNDHSTDALLNIKDTAIPPDKFADKSVATKSSLISNNLNNHLSSKFERTKSIQNKKSTKNKIKSTMKHLTFSLLKSSLSTFKGQLNSISPKYISNSHNSLSTPQSFLKVINNSFYSTKSFVPTSTSYSVQSMKTDNISTMESNILYENVTKIIEIPSVDNLSSNQTESFEHQPTTSFNSSDDEAGISKSYLNVNEIQSTTINSSLVEEIMPVEFIKTENDLNFTNNNESQTEPFSLPAVKSQSPSMQTTLSSFITTISNSTNLFRSQSNLSSPPLTTTKSSLPSNFSNRNKVSTFSFSHLPNINTFSPSSQSSVQTFNSQKTKFSQRRVEVVENEPINVYWSCPPTMVQSHGSIYKWFKVSSMLNNYTNSLPSKVDPITGNYILEIKENSASMGARYICINQKSSPFSDQEMYFYQIVVLQSKWIDVGSINEIRLYINQKAIINCPHGDIIKNNASLKGYNCSSRITIIENSSNSTKDIYQCSNSKNTSIKMPAVQSSTNCSLALMGCNLQTDNDDQINATKFTETADLINTDRCGFNNSSQLFSPRQPILCSGKIYMRFYFDSLEEKCLPFETNICRDDFFSFSSLQECAKTCSKIPSYIENCFYPQNVNESRHCSDKELQGKYLVSYDIQNGDCLWFYHCGVSNLTKNVFQSITICNKICVQTKKNVKMESIKACRYQEKINSSQVSGNLMTVWVFNKLSNKCETNLSNYNHILRFDSKIKCEKVCKGYGSTEICISRPDNGKCQQQRTFRWYYNKSNNQCVKILDGGCGESLNRFNSKISCEKMCTELIYRNVKTSYSTTTISLTQIKQSKMTSDRKSKTISFSKPTFRKRHHRQVSEINSVPYKFNQMKAFINSTLPKSFNASDRELDFDPCFKEALINTCDFGVGQHKYHMTRYTFKLRTGTCSKIQFSGCSSGENLFDDANDCKSACESRLHATLKSLSCQNPFFHNCMAPDSASNKKINQRYFFLSSSKECVKFNSTNSLECLNSYFTSVKQCQQECIPSTPKELMLNNRCFANIVLWETSCSEDQKISRWFYFKYIDQCLQYSTCPINYPGNTFQTKQECENVCRASNILTVCSLSKDAGVGVLRKVKYHYNRRLGKCQLFYYKGSLGNLNRFKTRMECEKACSVPMENTDEIKFSSLTSNLYYHKLYKGTISNETWLNENIDNEYCFDPHRYGGCAANQPQVFIKKYYYDPYSKQCEPYMFSGCGSLSRNSFDSISICDKMCTERVTRKTSTFCSQKVSKCSNSQWIYWIYNLERGVCEPFPSCTMQSSHQFFFVSESHCVQSCAPTLPMKKDVFDICHLPRTMNETCTILSERWFYDQMTRSCNSASSCEHYGNNFPSRIACLAACQPTSLKEICQLPMDKGPCNSNDTINYYFDWSTHTCKSFSYGGCLGNRNRFQTLRECQSVCPMRNQCNLKFNHPSKCDPHNLNVVSNLYHYDVDAGKCKRIEDFQCGDHTKFFTKEDECNQHCVVPSELKLIGYNLQNFTKPQNEICGEPLRYNVYPLCTKSDEWIPRFYYNYQHERCVFFYYNGCDGIEDKGNRFSTQNSCESICLGQSSTTGFTLTHYGSAPTHLITNHHYTTENIKILKDTVKDIQYKSGICPDSNYQCTQVQENSVKCESDIDCQSTWKCCSCETKSSILSMCIEPLNCITTKYGCCADGITFATDELHLNCKKIKPTIDGSSLPELISHNSENDLILNCQVSGDPKPAISWIYLENNTFTIYPQSINLDLLQPFWTGQIEISQLEYKYGMWVCLANNDVGMDEKEVFVHKSSQKDPFLRIHSFDSNIKASINVTVNNRVVIHCPIYGFPRPVITWYFNKVAVNATVWSLLIFNRHLLIDKATFIHAGIWTCQAENKWGKIPYKIRLKVLDAIQIIPPSMGTKIKANLGQQIILFCNVQVEGNCSINWYWEIGKTKKIIIPVRQTDSRILKISSFQNQFMGSYICEASNNFSSTKLKYKIVPYNTNEITIYPNGALFVGTTVILECPTKLSEKISPIIWKKDNIHINTNSAKLKLVLSSKLESGFYTCEENKKTYLTYLSVLDVPQHL